MLDLNKIKKAYPQPEHTSYFNTSSTGLVSLSGIEKAHKFNEKLHKYGSQQAEYYNEKVIPETVCITEDGLMVGAMRSGNYSWSDDLGKTWHLLNGIPDYISNP